MYNGDGMGLNHNSFEVSLAELGPGSARKNSNNQGE